MAAPNITPGLFSALPEAAAPPAEPAGRVEFPHLWLCIHLPRLALEALHEQFDGPVVVIDGADSNSVVYVANESLA
ncbi:MAG: hypothetical protein OEQ74_07840, partial [Gammaproteobacteria bacterium]|nr:hypothetical protein [Gammaproteobacteria bacterium]